MVPARYAPSFVGFISALPLPGITNSLHVPVLNHKARMVHVHYIQHNHPSCTINACDLHMEYAETYLRLHVSGIKFWLGTLYYIRCSIFISRSSCKHAYVATYGMTKSV